MPHKLKYSLPIAFLSLSLAACGSGGTGGNPSVLPNSGSSSTTMSSTTSTAYAGAVLADAPTAYFHLSDTGTTAYDSSGHALNGSIGSSITKSVSGLVASSPDKAMSFSGTRSSSGIVHVAVNTKLQPSTAVSVEGLLRLSATQSSYAVPVAYGADTTGESAPYEWFFLNGKLVAQFVLSSGVAIVSSPSALLTNTTYHVVSTFDGTTAKLFLNGKLVASVSKTGTLKGYRDGLGIGDDPGYTNPAFKGTIDEVAIYAGKALTAAQIANHYAATQGSASAPAPAATPSATPTNAPTAAPTAAPTVTPTSAPTAAPTVAPTTAPVAGNVATYQGCPVFTAGDYYNAPIANAAIDPNSANYISSVVNSGDTAGFYASTGVEKINPASNSTPLLTVKQQVSYHTFPAPYPWASGFYIEPLSDKHAMVVQTQSCHLYEAYSTTYSSGALSAYSGANWDLTKPFVPMTAGQPSAMASGLSIFAGMVKWEDYQSGEIRHALNWAAIAGSVAQYKFVRPASDTDQLAFKGTSSYQLPYGAHLRLKASFSTAGWGPEATMVANAMKTYGIYLADTGSSGNALYFANAADGSNPWSSSDLSALSKIHVSDFDVVTMPAVQTVPGH